MATLYSEIYCLNEAIMTDSKISNIPSNIKFFVLSLYLDFAVAEFREYCNVNLDDRTEFEQEIYTFTGNNVDDTFNLTPAPPTGAQYYVSIDGTELDSTEYTILTSPDRIQFTSVSSNGADIYVGAYNVGEFAGNLNIDEKRILAEGMTVPFAEGYINLTKHLNQIMYGEGVNFYSQANHTRSNLSVKDSNYKRLRQMISRYTYVNSPNSLEGLSGGNQ